MMMPFNLTIALRAVQTIFSIIILGLTAYVVHWYNAGYWRATAPSEFAFLLFSSSWSLIALIFLTLAPRFLSYSATTRSSGSSSSSSSSSGGVGALSSSSSSSSSSFRQAWHGYIALSIDVLTSILWLIGWVFLTAFLVGRECYGIVCNCARASAAFAAFQWVLFTAAVGLSLRDILVRRRQTAELKSEMRAETKQFESA